MLDTAKGPELKILVEKVKDLLDKNIRDILEQYGIQEKSKELKPTSDLIGFELLEDKQEQLEFIETRNSLHKAIIDEVVIIKDKWQFGYMWYLDKIVYSFFNRIFAVRIMEELDLLDESTLKPQSDLGNRSARMAKIQEKFPYDEEKWWFLLLHDVFQELNQEIKVIFDPNDLTLQVFPDDTTINQIVEHLNNLDPELYRTEDCIGWFYHYYVLKIRKGHKTMSSHGSKSPPNPYYLSILNTVYTPRWMVRILVDNSLGHWWVNHYPSSTQFSDSPYFIQKVPNDLVLGTQKLEDLQILDPACGSGNFLVYTFSKLVSLYKESYPTWTYSEIISTILKKNLYGIDINRRPVQLSVIALFILAKKIIKEMAPHAYQDFQMPSVNIICCDIRLPEGSYKQEILRKIPEDQKPLIEEIMDLFDNADKIGSLIDVRDLQKELLKFKKKNKGKPMDKFVGLKPEQYIVDIRELVEKIIDNNSQNLGLQIFVNETKKSLTMAQVLLKKYDILMGNPPFGLTIDETKKQLKKYYPHSYADLVAMFVDQGLRILKENGYLAYVTDFSFLHLPKFENFRRNIMLSKTTIQYLLITGLGALPNARNVPSLFVVRKSNKMEQKGLYRYVEYSSSTQFTVDVYIHEILRDIATLNATSDGILPEGWNRIAQQIFPSLPRAVIDLTIEEKYTPLLEFFGKYPRLDFSQHNKEEKKALSKKDEITRAYQGFATGNNDVFVKLWFEVPIEQIRIYDPISSTDELSNFLEKPFVPYSKGGGDLRYYMQNPFVLWWNKDGYDEMQNYDSVLRNLPLQGKSDLKWALSSGKPRGRFILSQNAVISDVASMSIVILDEKMDKYYLLAYLNSRFASYFGRLQTKDRKWQAGTIARFPIPINISEEYKNQLSELSKESFQLRKVWDTNYPMSPIYSECLIDKIFYPNNPIDNLGEPKTNHPFVNEYYPIESEFSQEINAVVVQPEKATIDKILNACGKRFKLLIGRLDAIDEEINQILYKLIDEPTQQALDEYYNSFVGVMEYKPEPDIWLQDFLMANLMDLIKQAPKGISTFYNFDEKIPGLYQQFIQLLCKKFDRSEQNLQPILKELEEYLGESLEKWIRKDFFFYHIQRFGGRPIIWQLTSNKNSRLVPTLDIFLHYHQLNDNSLATIRVDIIQPLLQRLERQKDTGVLKDNEFYKIEELEDFLKSFIELERGYLSIPTPNSLTGNRSSPGKGDDQTWAWTFSEASKIIEQGYKPDLFKGVLINIIPLCLNLPENKKETYTIQYRSLTPKGTIKKILKKLDSLDQLKQTSVKKKKKK